MTQFIFIFGEMKFNILLFTAVIISTSFSVFAVIYLHFKMHLVRNYDAISEYTSQNFFNKIKNDNSSAGLEDADIGELKCWIVE